MSRIFLPASLYAEPPTDVLLIILRQSLLCSDKKDKKTKFLSNLQSEVSGVSVVVTLHRLTSHTSYPAQMFSCLLLGLNDVIALYSESSFLYTITPLLLHMHSFQFGVTKRIQITGVLVWLYRTNFVCPQSNTQY